MATTTVRLSEDEERVLTALAKEYGGRSNVLREGLRILGERERQRIALGALLEEWEQEDGPVSEEGVERMRQRYFAP
ncbi:MAG: type II toxin-antitoxin system ParD family antitoxin [Solirubrobacterales bacterium]|nr:type II toxin-antitoxin system ParD family antitoxin [Solirubrobacterales bacterium]